MKTVGIILTSMRPDKVKLVIDDLYKQSIIPDKVILIDNGCNIDDIDITLLAKGFHLICVGENIGTNQSWNKMWELDTDYVGIVADDLRLDPNMIEIMIEGLNKKYDKHIPGIVTATISHRIKLPKSDPNRIIGEPTRSKGQCGALLMKRCTLQCIPKIPKEFFIFFGDNWLGYWLGFEGLSFIRLNTYVHHIPGPDDVSKNMDYKSVLESERGHWKSFLRGLKDYSL